MSSWVPLSPLGDLSADEDEDELLKISLKTNQGDLLKAEDK